MDYFVYVLMCLFLIVGVYQFYFWTQNNNKRTVRSLEISFDRKFKLKPKWVWIYSGLYYPIIVFIIFSVSDMREFNYTAMNFFFLLFFQMLFFYYFPVATPSSWREHIHGDKYSVKLLKLVYRIDKSSNCFPSMHVSVATLTAMHLMNNLPNIGYWSLLFPLLIAFSALYTKQHYILDLLPGAVLGWLVFQLHLVMYAP